MMNDDPVALNVHIHLWDGPGGEDRYRFWMRDERTGRVLLRGHGASKGYCFSLIRTWALAAGYASMEDVGLRDQIVN